jgi:hypothetical protein
MGTGHLQHACRPAPKEMVRILSPMSRVLCVTISRKCLNVCARREISHCYEQFQNFQLLPDMKMLSHSSPLDVNGLETLTESTRRPKFLHLAPCRAFLRRHELVRLHEADELRWARAKMLRVQASPKTLPLCHKPREDLAAQSQAAIVFA